MLSREARLRTKAQFRAAMSDGARISRPAVAARAVLRAEAGPSRIGFVVTKRIGGAVERNRAVRRMRGAVRNCEVTPSGWDIVLVARPGILEADTKELQTSIYQIMEELGRAQA